MITASWPINTEAEGSLHIKDKAAANSTIFLVCRPKARSRDPEVRDAAPVYWEDVEPRVARAVRERVDEFSGSRHPRRRSVSCLVRSRARGVFPALAAATWHAAGETGHASTAAPGGTSGGGLGPLRRHAG